MTLGWFGCYLWFVLFTLLLGFCLLLLLACYFGFVFMFSLRAALLFCWLFLLYCLTLYGLHLRFVAADPALISCCFVV